MIAARPAGLAAVGKALELASLVLLLTLVPRSLGPDDYGFFAVVTSLVALGSISLALGGPVLMARFVPSVPAEKRLALGRALAARTAIWRGAALAVAAVAVIGVAGTRGDLVPLVPAVLVLVALAVDVAATVLFQLALALQRVAAWTARYPLQNLVLVVGTIVLGTTIGRVGILLAVVLSTAAALVLAVAITRHTGPVSTWEGPLPEGVGRFSLLQGAGSAAQILGQRAGILAVAAVGAASTETGYAGLAIGIALALIATGMHPFVAELPRLVERSAVEPSEVDQTVDRLGWIVLAILGAGAVVAALLSEPILRLAAGDEYLGASDALVVALAAVPFAAPLGMLSVTTAIRLRPGVRLISFGVGLVTTSVVALLAVPGHGAVGGAAAFSVGTAVTVVTAFAVLPRAVPFALLAATTGIALLITVAAVVA